MIEVFAEDELIGYVVPVDGLSFSDDTLWEPLTFSKCSMRLLCATQEQAEWYIRLYEGLERR